MIEERIVELYPEQEMRCPIHLSIGQEAAAVGACACLNDNDYVMSAHRSHGHFLARGGNLKAFFAEFYGKESGCCSGYGGSMHLIDLSVGFLGAVPIVGSTIPIGTGAAFSSKLKNEDRISMVFFGEGATEEGVFYESINFAALHNLPVVYICENNLYSVYSPLSVRQPEKRNLMTIVEGIGLSTDSGNGNDVMEVYDKVNKAVADVRSDKGPVLLEFATYRWREHCGPNYDNDLGYRTPDEFEEWKERCPLEKARRELIASGQLDPEEEKVMMSRIKDEIDEALLFAQQSDWADPAGLEDRVYAP